MRYALRIAETGFDPAQITDLYSRTIAANIFEAPYQYEFLARPVRLRPSTTVAMPEVAVRPRTTTEISRILALASRERIPVTTRAAGNYSRNVNGRYER